MSQIRKAHSVEIIDRRLRDCEIAGAVDAMELVGIYDELARVERKWREKFAAAPKTGGHTRTRPLSDATKMNLRFERLARLVEAALRQAISANDPLLKQAGEMLRKRIPLPTAAETPATDDHKK